jgi:hypothetical protein
MTCGRRSRKLQRQESRKSNRQEKKLVKNFGKSSKRPKNMSSIQLTLLLKKPKMSKMQQSKKHNKLDTTYPRRLVRPLIRLKR